MLLLLLNQAVSGVYRPTSDITTTGWTAVPGPNFWDMVDESVANDADYNTAYLTPGVPLVMGIPPTSAGSKTVTIRAAVTSGSATFRAKLLDGAGATLATAADQPINTTPTNYDLSVSIAATASRVSIEVV